MTNGTHPSAWPSSQWVTLRTRVSHLLLITVERFWRSFQSANQSMAAHAVCTAYCALCKAAAAEWPCAVLHTQRLLVRTHKMQTGKVVECIRAHMGGVAPRPGALPASGSGSAAAGKQRQGGAAAAAADGGGGAAAAGAGGSGCAAACCTSGRGCCATPAVPWTPHSALRCKAFVDRWACIRY